MSTTNQFQHISRWVLLPLRLFLGITFMYAGLQKLADPQFFNPAARGYVGKQIAAFATGSPLHAFLLQVAAPHATLFGLLVAYGELAIGIGTLLGMLFRLAAFFGLLISLMLFLSATWHVYPYFYGSDIAFAFSWLTLLLAGPLYSGLPSLDTLFVQRYLSPRQRKQLAPFTSFFLGVGEEEAQPVNPAGDYRQLPQGQSKQTPGNKRPTQQQSRYAMAQQAKNSRRNFLLGALTGGAGILGLTWLWNTLNIFPQSAQSNTIPSTDGGTSATATTPANTGTPTSSASPIAQVNAVQNNSAVTFTLASNGDPGILVRLNSGKFVAYDAACTHAGCPVDYDPGSQMLVCPCHGATFDPAKSATVVQGPANTPLTSVPIHIDNTTGAITSG